MDKYEMEPIDFYNKIKEESRSLESRLDAITLTDKEIREVTKNKTFKTLRDEGLHMVGPFGRAIATVMGWNEEVEEEFKKIKEQKLMFGYFEKTEEQLDVINKLKDFVTDPYGFTIFSKIRLILDQTPPDSTMIDHLSTVLVNMINTGKFDILFEKNKYILNQVEKMTPQSLTMIADSNTWPTFNLNVSTFFGGKVSSEFHNEFGEVYARQKGITNEELLNRIIHSVRELENANLIEAYRLSESTNLCEVRLTNIGTEIFNYLNIE